MLESSCNVTSPEKGRLAVILGATLSILKTAVTCLVEVFTEARDCKPIEGDVVGIGILRLFLGNVGVGSEYKMLVHNQVVLEPRKWHLC